MYLTVMEAGLSCIAVNLPSLWFIFHKATPEGVLRSVRSMISLASIRSGGSRDSRGKSNHKSNNYPNMDQNESAASSSQSHLERPDAIPIETHALYDIEAKHTPVPSGMGNRDVQVTQTISQSSSKRVM